jgi:hypothetical protein
MKKLALLLSAFLIGSLLQAQNLPSYLPANGLVGWWPFNGNANDLSGREHHGVNSSAVLSTDRFGNLNGAYSFNGINAKITIPHSSELNAFPLSVFAWCKTGDPSSNGIVAKYPAGNNNNGWSIHGSFSGYYYNYLGGAFVNFDGNLNLQQQICNNMWHFVGMVCDNQKARLYVDGQLVIERSYSGSGAQSACTNSDNLFIGKIGNLDSPGAFFNGQIDDVVLYNRVLSEQEITTMYNAPSIGGGGGSNTYSSLSWPQGISYQALARNAQGTPLLNTALQIRFSLLADSINGAVEYAESQALNSNAQGLINTAFGGGTAITGTWAGINWAKGRKFLKVELNPGGGFVNLGVQELLSVPFSQRSRSAAVLENSSLPVFSGNSAALTGGLLPGQLYRTSAGVLMVVY